MKKEEELRIMFALASFYASLLDEFNKKFQFFVEAISYQFEKDKDKDGSM